MSATFAMVTGVLHGQPITKATRSGRPAFFPKSKFLEVKPPNGGRAVFFHKRCAMNSTRS
jgi:hypothetical protein